MWKAKTKDGNEVSELNTQWNDVKDNISELLLITKDNKAEYTEYDINNMRYEKLKETLE